MLKKKLALLLLALMFILSFSACGGGGGGGGGSSSPSPDSPSKISCLEWKEYADPQGNWEARGIFKNTGGKTILKARIVAKLYNSGNYLFGESIYILPDLSLESGEIIYVTMHSHVAHAGVRSVRKYADWKDELGAYTEDF